MAYDVLSLDELTEFIVSYYSNRLPGFSVDRLSDGYKELRTLALAVADTHAHLDAVLKALDPFRAEKADLTALARVFKVYRKGATVARGVDVLRVTGANGTALLTTQTLFHQGSGQRYQLGENGTIPAAGYLDVDLVALVAGSAGRLKKGETLVFDSTPPGANATAELQKDIDIDGLDEEDDNSLRSRLLFAIAHPPEAGSVEDWQRWATAVTGVDVAFVYPHRNFAYAVDIAAFHFGTGTGRFLLPSERATLLAALQAVAPANSQVRVLETIGDAQPIVLLIDPTSTKKYGRDWNDATPPTVAAYTSGTRTLQFAGGARPADMQKGDRICWAGVSGEGSEIESLSGADSIVLKANPSTPPPVATPIYSGGPLTAPVVAAVAAYLAGLGPALGDFGNDWDDSIRLAQLANAAQSVAGVLDSTVSTPAAGYTPADLAFPSDAQVPAVVPSYILVRYR